jgi:hypothetical protein
MADRLRLASITFLRDEATIVEAFLRHNSRFVDRMFVIDDGSRDATPEIIALLRQEGLDIELIDRPRSGGFYHSYSTTSALVEILANGEWDAVVPLDADEFLVADSRAAFEEDICGIPSGSVGGLSPIHYALSTRDDPTIENDLVRIQHGHDLWPRAWKVLVPAMLGRSGNASFSEGNHAFLVGGIAAPSHTLRTRLAHFRARSPDELVAKSLTAHIRWRAREDFAEGLVEHRTKVVRSICESPSLAIPDEVAGRIASRFLIGMEPEDLVRQPFDASHAIIRFKHLATMKPYEMIVAAVDDLIADSRTTAPPGTEERAKDLHARLATLRGELAQTNQFLASTKAELNGLKGSSRRLIATALALVGRRLKGSIAKRWRRWSGRSPT